MTKTNMSSNLVKPIIGILTSRLDLLGEVVRAFEPHFGGADVTGPWRPFTHSSYYEDEMGAGLHRCFVSFEKLVEPELAVEFKLWGAKVEDSYRVDGRRTVNVDPGYLDANKVVLMTGKHGGHKIAVARGVYADMLLWYNKGWQAFPWAFPDFRDGSHFDTFTKMRTKFKKQVRII